MTAKPMDKVTSREERASSSEGEIEASRIKKRQSMEFEDTLRKEYLAEENRLLENWEKRRKHNDDPQATQFVEKEFGEEIKKIKNTFFGNSVVSIGLFREKVMVFACSGTSVKYWNKKIQQPHAIFVTSKYLADEFESNRTKDDNLRIKVRLPDNTTITGFLGLCNDKIATVMAFTIPCVYPVNIREPLDLQRFTDSPNTYAYGRTHDGRLMFTDCSCLDFSEAVVSCNCDITEVGLGGPVISFDEDGIGNFAGVMVEVNAKFLPTKLLNEQLQLFGQAVT